MNAARKLPRSNGYRALLGVLLVGGLACDDQPKPSCISSPLPYAVKLNERSRDESTPGACDAFGASGFNVDPEVGLVSYFRRDSKGQPNYDEGTVGIQTAELGTLVDTAQTYGEDNTADDAALYSSGKFAASIPDKDNLCSVPKLTKTHVVLPELPEVADDPATEDDDETFAGQPAIDVTLEWSNIKVYLTAAVIGTEFQADLTDTRLTPDGESCTIKYRAVGLAPAVACGVSDPDSGMPLFNDGGMPMIDPVSCDPRPDPDEGRFEGSGISPNVRYVCDPDIAYCVPKGDTISVIQ